MMIRLALASLIFAGAASAEICLIPPNVARLTTAAPPQATSSCGEPIGPLVCPKDGGPCWWKWEPCVETTPSGWSKVHQRPSTICLTPTQNAEAEGRWR
jgi:hypothetical protein